ncbi:FAD-dependent oxidoreductase [Parabacteroides sp. PF5-9]|uniref:FAD-dependent oxidoreductase n=1 Tax=Parabacteroides sp. PF5-9 TaxID=1742404 RepID=UPI002473B9A4|nr:FAD-dependent oxidoreductase [Parabacteroides sp. PF5-9]MDH6356734.1 flavin-dependent dehydrogenase [Parabacteroides sp. PF5-9]
MITRRDFIQATAAGSALASFGKLSAARTTVEPLLPDEGYAMESKREIPVIAETDLVVVGGSSRAVAAAVAAAKSGCNVFLIAAMPYLGDDICGSFLIDRKEEESLDTALSRKIFLGKTYPTPLHVKTVLENELIDHGVDFLYSCYATNAITDASRHVGGVVFVSRSGRQTIRCKAVIDATHTASVAALFEVPFRAATTTEQEFDFTVVGNTPKTGTHILKANVLDKPFVFKEKSYPVTRYTCRLPFDGNSYAALMEAEQIIRSETWDPDQVDSADLLWYTPSQQVVAQEQYLHADTDIRNLPITAFQPKGMNGLWVLGPCADIPRTVASQVMRPVPALFLGELLGEQIAEKIKPLTLPSVAEVYSPNRKASNYGRVGEVLKPLRVLQQKGYVHIPSGSLPVWGTYDVVVLGGGTAGASAGISSARQGAKTLVLEYLHALGGLGTAGLIGRYWDGFREGYSSTIDQGVKEMAPKNHSRQLKKWTEEAPVDWKMEWLRRELLKAKGELWFGVLGCGALVEDQQVKGVVVSTPFGRGVILSKVLIDSSGSADIAIAAGASYEYTGKKTLAVQGAGMGKRDPEDFYVNNDWLFTDDTDILDVSRVYVQSKVKFKGHYDIVKMPQTRERRRVIGEHIVSVYDVLNHRRYPDTISYHKSSFDTHGMIVDPFFILSPPMERHTVYDADVPLRALLPKGLEGILTTGLGASAHRDAMPVIRMQPCLQNQGYAVGYLSAVSVKEGKPLRKVDIKKIQQHLVRIGNLPERVLKDKAFKGYSHQEMRQAAESVVENYKGLEILLTDKERCLKLLHEQIKKTTTSDSRVIYASILCILGDATYCNVLEEKIRQYTAWDKGWHYTGMHQFGMSMSRLDALLIALGNAADKKSLPVILEKAKLLNPEDYFSHFRAITKAFESVNSQEAIPILSEMLTAPGVRFYDIDSYVTARNQVVPDEIDVTIRNRALKELHLARALYLCGDKDGMGEMILKRYANSLQGHYARYAEEVLGL